MMKRNTGTRSTCLGHTNTTKDRKDDSSTNNKRSSIDTVTVTVVNVTVTVTVTATLTDMSDRWDGTH